MTTVKLKLKGDLTDIERINGFKTIRELDKDEVIAFYSLLNTYPGEIIDTSINQITFVSFDFMIQGVLYKRASTGKPDEVRYEIEGNMLGQGMSATAYESIGCLELLDEIQSINIKYYATPKRVIKKYKIELDKDIALLRKKINHEHIVSQVYAPLKAKKPFKYKGMDLHPAIIIKYFNGIVFDKRITELENSNFTGDPIKDRIEDSIELLFAVWQLPLFDLVHSDIKPDNAIYNSNVKRIHLIDPGLGTRTTHNDYLNITGSTPMYASPEQFHNADQLIKTKIKPTHETDIYNTGVTIADIWHLGTVISLTKTMMRTTTSKEVKCKEVVMKMKFDREFDRKTMTDFIEKIRTSPLNDDQINGIIATIENMTRNDQNKRWLENETIRFFENLYLQVTKDKTSNEAEKKNIDAAFNAATSLQNIINPGPTNYLFSFSFIKNHIINKLNELQENETALELFIFMLRFYSLRGLKSKNDIIGNLIHYETIIKRKDVIMDMKNSIKDVLKAQIDIVSSLYRLTRNLNQIQLKNKFHAHFCKLKNLQNKLDTIERNQQGTDKNTLLRKIINADGYINLGNKIASLETAINDFKKNIIDDQKHNDFMTEINLLQIYGISLDEFDDPFKQVFFKLYQFSEQEALDEEPLSEEIRFKKGLANLILTQFNSISWTKSEIKLISLINAKMTGTTYPALIDQLLHPIQHRPTSITMCNPSSLAPRLQQFIYGWYNDYRPQIRSLKAASNVGM